MRSEAILAISLERSNMAEKENRVLVQQGYQCFKTGDMEGLLSLFSAQIDWELPEVEGLPFSGHRKGRDEVADFFRLVREAQESLEFDPKEYVCEGNQVVAIGYYRWRVRSTGKTFESNFVHVFTIKENLVVGFREFLDSAALAAAHK